MSDFTVTTIVNELRRRLIDIGRSNALIHFPPRPGLRKSVRLIDDSIDHVHSVLTEGAVQIMAETKLPKVSDDAGQTVPLLKDVPAPGLTGEDRPFRRMAKAFKSALPINDVRYDLTQAGLHQDRLQSDLPIEELEARLLGIARDHASSMAETGVGMTCAVLGTLEWPQAPQSSQNNISPLLLLPLSIEKTVQRSRHVHTLRSDEGEMQTNAALREALRNDYGIELPHLREDELPSTYLDRIQEIVAATPGWRVHRHATVALMKSMQMAVWRDLDVEKWDVGIVANHRLLPTLLGVEACENRTGFFEGDHDVPGLMDQSMGSVPPIIFDADTSQHSAIIDVIDGHDVAIEGPPGSGKSQTIANMIAASVNAGRNILFVAEKKTALDVVAARLRDRGFGSLILELHGANANKAEVAKSLYRRVQATATDQPPTLIKTRTAMRTKTSELRAHLRATTSMLASGADLHDEIWRSIDLSSRLGPEIARMATLMPEPPASSDIEEIGRMLSEHLEAHTAAAAIRPETSAWSFVPVNTKLDTGLVKAHALDIAARLDAIESDADGGTLSGWRPDLVECRNLLERRQLLTSVTSGSSLLLATINDADTISEFLDAALLVRSAREEINAIDEALAGAPRQDLEVVIELSGTMGIRDGNQLGQRLHAMERVLQQDEQVTRLASRVRAIFRGQDLPNVSKLAEAATALHSYNSLGDEEQSIRSLASNASWVSDVQGFSNALDALDAEAEKLMLHVDAEEALRVVPSDLEADIIIVRSAGFLEKMRAPYKAAVARLTKLLINPSQDVEVAIRRAADVISIRRRYDSCVENPALIRVVPRIFWEDGRPDFDRLRDVHARLEEVSAGIGRTTLDHEAVLNMDKATLTEMAFDLTNIMSAMEGVAEHVVWNEHADQARRSIDDMTRLRALITRCGLDGDTSLVPWLLQLIDRYHDLSIKHERLASAAPASEADLRRAVAEAEIIKAAGLPEKLLGDVLSSDDIPARISSIIKAVSQRADRIAAAIEAFGTLSGIIGVSVEDIIGADPRRVGSWKSLSQRFAALDAEHGSYDARVRLALSTAKIKANDLQQVVEYLITAGAKPSDAAEAYVYRSARSVAHRGIADMDEFTRRARPHHQTLDQARAQVRQLDADLQKLDAENIVNMRLEMTRRIEGIGKGTVHEWTERSLVDREMIKQRKHVPIRELVRRAWNDLSELKPIWLMSPSTVAQFLPQVAGMFDVLVIDEASQMLPEYAIGAMLRSRQSVVVGDPNQMPPTTTFSRTAIGDNQEAAEVIEDVESILDMANRSFPKRRRLRWHYRSQHPSLIAFSNQRFYGDELVISPSAAPKAVDLGVHFHLVGNPSYHSGLNKPEADEVVSAVAGLVRSHPQHTIAVVAMNAKQAEYISEQIELLELDDAAYKEHVAIHPAESEKTIVVSLENCQGHERDIVLLSTLYGPDIAGGKVAQQFTGINSTSGHRRLNVMATRAKRAVHVFSSMRAADIRGGATNRGVDDLKAYLQYAEDGLLIENADGRMEPESGFERVVGEALRNAGYGVIYQVGVKGFRIDIGVTRHPGDTTFIAGIECDGAIWHRGLSVRERDRIRQGVLEGLGWRMHRIWSTDWYHDTKTETERMITWLRSIQLAEPGLPLLTVVDGDGRRKGGDEADQVRIQGEN